MSAAEAGHIAAMATARAARLKEIEQNKNNRGGKNNKKGKGGNKRKRGAPGGGAEFGEGDFIEDYLPGGKKYRKGGNGNGPGDPFGLAGGDGEGGGGGGGGSLATPSAPRNVRLADLGGIEESLQAIRELILCPLLHPELYSWLGVDPPRGVLLHGPPAGTYNSHHALIKPSGRLSLDTPFQRRLSHRKCPTVQTTTRIPHPQAAPLLYHIPVKRLLFNSGE